MSYNAKIYKQSAVELVIDEGGFITVQPGGYIAGASPYDDIPIIGLISETEGVMTAEERGKFNDVLVALQNIGVIVLE